MEDLKMEESKVCMFKLFLFIAILTLSSSLFAKTVELEVMANKSDVTANVNSEDLLILNGFRQAVTAELEDLKLDSKLYWSKVEEKKLSGSEELQLLKTFFDNVSLSFAAPLDAKEAKEAQKDEVKLSGKLKANLNSDKLKDHYLEIATGLGETKFKTFYILANIDIDSSMNWADVGVTQPENFSGAVIASWKKLIEKEFKSFEKVVVLDKDFANKPDYMNSKSVTLKWNSTYRKVFNNTEDKTAIYELSAQYILVNTKSGTVLSSFDYPTQKRELETQNKKGLSSALASLVYNLLPSQTSKISSLLESENKAPVQSQLEIKITTKTGLSEIFAINTLLQEKFKDIKLSSSMKSYSSDSASLLISAEGSETKILDSLSLEGGKFPLNEQKILLFNRADKSFAILPKDSNNKN